ncbi:MAG: DUF4854 domain-containing protein [Clostridiales bacterium]|nr:DUF4854 domain-containing protein [Clostridiales bacterium]
MKNMKRWIAVFVCLVLCLAFAAGCSSNKTVADYIKANEKTFDAAKKAVEGQGMKVDILARENSLVYTYQFEQEMTKEQIDVLGETLKAAIEAEGATFQSVLKSLRTAVPSAESVIVEYLDSHGGVICSTEFK